MKVSKSFNQFAASIAVCLLAGSPVAAPVSKDAPVPPVRRDDPAPRAEPRAPLTGSDRQMMETMAEIKEKFFMKTNPSIPPTVTCKKGATQLEELVLKGEWTGFSAALTRRSPP